MNDEERINYYLGTILSQQKTKVYVNYDLIKTGLDTIIDFNLTLTPSLENNYKSPLNQILLKTNNQNKKFVAVFGDIQRHVDFTSLVKIRCPDNTDSVILRCLNFKYHWNDFYNKPQDMPFEQKINKIFWRGATTGVENRKGNRFDLIKSWFQKDINIDVGFSILCQNKQAYFNFVKGSCKTDVFLKHKYILSIEGNDKDTGINWKLNSNSLVLMPKPRFTSWLMESTLVPNYHYVLLNDDFSDLKEKFNWCTNNQAKCKEIISNANLYMKQFSDNKKEEKLEEEVIKRYINLLN